MCDFIAKSCDIKHLNWCCVRIELTHLSSLAWWTLKVHVLLGNLSVISHKILKKIMNQNVLPSTQHYHVNRVRHIS